MGSQQVKRRSLISKADNFLLPDNLLFDLGIFSDILKIKLKISLVFLVPYLHSFVYLYFCKQNHEDY